jgi:hypothetical protein
MKEIYIGLLAARLDVGVTFAVRTTEEKHPSNMSLLLG